MSSCVTPTAFYSRGNKRESTALFFIPGNPGLIAYYHVFLSLVSERLSGAFQVYGRSLGGFLDPETRLNLEEQIVFVQGLLNDFMTERQKVILIGHSVGAYIAMELLRRHRQQSSADFDIIGGIMLFPTVVDIAKSASGQKLTVGDFRTVMEYTY